MRNSYVMMSLCKKSGISRKLAKPSFVINDVHWLPAEHMLHIGIMKRVDEHTRVLSKQELKRCLADNKDGLHKLIKNSVLVKHNIFPDYTFIDTMHAPIIVLCLFLLPDERWGIDHLDITHTLKLLDTKGVNFFLMQQQANYSDGRIDAIVMDAKNIIKQTRREFEGVITERERGI